MINIQIRQFYLIIIKIQIKVLIMKIRWIQIIVLNFRYVFFFSIKITLNNFYFFLPSKNVPSFSSVSSKLFIDINNAKKPTKNCTGKGEPCSNNGKKKQLPRKNVKSNIIYSVFASSIIFFSIIIIES